jgi:7,8-dihydroneopterin aldolase/epimerase/oxygenase
MIDRLRIDGLMIHAYHGVMRHEGKVGQTFRLDIIVELCHSSRGDKLRDTVSHHLIVRIVQEAFCARPYRLVEAAAGAVADALLQTCPQIGAVRIVVHKPHAPVAATFADIGVAIQRLRTSSLPSLP